MTNEEKIKNEEGIKSEDKKKVDVKEKGKKVKQREAFRSWYKRNKEYYRRYYEKNKERINKRRAEKYGRNMGRQKDIIKELEDKIKTLEKKLGGEK